MSLPVKGYLYIGKQIRSEIINSLVELDQWKDSFST